MVPKRGQRGRPADTSPGPSMSSWDTSVRGRTLSDLILFAAPGFVLMFFFCLVSLGISCSNEGLLSQTSSLGASRPRSGRRTARKLSAAFSFVCLFSVLVWRGGKRTCSELLEAGAPPPVPAGWLWTPVARLGPFGVQTNTAAREGVYCIPGGRRHCCWAPPGPRAARPLPSPAPAVPTSAALILSPVCGQWWPWRPRTPAEQLRGPARPWTCRHVGDPGAFPSSPRPHFTQPLHGRCSGIWSLVHSPPFLLMLLSHRHSRCQKNVQPHRQAPGTGSPGPPKIQAPAPLNFKPP